ncbi:MAG: protein-L-isoaspartate(D-aspartate) O-methyltransferase [Acidobacteria bacterium]|nr:protein-L-isoaspartate(D-aspartate) O-methyltransferase [Acidobacteriota bacterium]
MLYRGVLVLFLCLTGSFCGSREPASASAAEEHFQVLRERMVAEQLMRRDIRNRLVLDAMRTVPRHEFVPWEERESSYDDRPLPIREDQTISQPYIVALMTQLSDPKTEHRALEIGTGSGYQAAILSKLVREVFTIEIIPSLAERARETLKRLGFSNVIVRTGDGYQGWPEKAPFDIILVTAAAGTIPHPLLEQLAESGKLVMPVGAAGNVQMLTVVEKKNGRLKERRVSPVRFVPMTGEVQKTSWFRKFIYVRF